MSKKNHAPKISFPKQAGNKKQQQKVSVQKQSGNKQKQWLVLAVLAVLAVITFAVFYPSLKCEFTNWDDGTYVTENPMIWKLDGKAIKEIFSVPVSLNYHPLTMLSLALDYKLDKLNPYYYHLNNVLIHILNTLLIFVFIRMFMEGYNRKLVSEKFRPNPFNVALIVSVLFAIHPMRVESVTWVAERKDVLYMFFFLLSLIAYIYPDPKGRKGLTPFRAGATFVFFICSCLSKGMGVVLPVVLVLIDWFYGEGKTVKQISQSIIKKTHFFIAALVFGVIAFEIQSHGAIAAMGTFTLFQRLTFGCYGFIMYIYKLLLPINLSAFYPYPFTDDHGNIPPIYYASPFIVLFIALAIFFILKKKEIIGKVLAFGFAFYFITIALVLQFLSVGSVIMADRYAYVSYTGIFFIIGFSFEYVRKYFSSSISNLLAGILIVAAGYFSYLTHERTKVWTNAETLWTDAMNQFPFIEIAYENRGIYYKDHNELDKMQKDYEIITGIDQSKIKLAPTRNEKIWSNLGNLYGLQQKFDKSLDAYSHAIEINPKNSGTYLNRAITYSMMKQYEKSIPDYDKSLELAPDVALTYKNRAYTLLQLGQYAKSISDYDKAIELYPYDTISVLNRGIAKFNAQKLEAAITDFKNYIKMVPNNAEANYNASIASKNLNRFAEALQFAQRAVELKYPVSQQYMDELKSKLK
ncbi:MAG: tetratricopeptide repeat protein [Bacteroidetes bacterium]|nr:tetratricopeptide repeat protein [Bacteroidota bacterium]